VADKLARQYVVMAKLINGCERLAGEMTLGFWAGGVLCGRSASLIWKKRGRIAMTALFYAWRKQ